MEIYYNDAGCGSGKTFEALKEIAKGGRHVFAADRVESLRERAQQLKCLVSDEALPEIVTIYAPTNFQAVTPSVRARIEEVPDQHADTPDIVVFITHEALKLASWEGYSGQGWSLWIDEVPNALDNDEGQFGLSWDKLATIYALEPDDDVHWSRVRLLDEAVDVAALAKDNALQVLRPFHRRVSDPRRSVLVNITDWEELRGGKRKMAWYCVWSPEELQHFDAVFMLGNDLMKSVTARCWLEHWPEFSWTPLSSSSRAFLPRTVTITYFAEEHRASRSLFGSKQGQENLKKVADWLSTRGIAEDLIWTCNNDDQPLLETLMPGTWLRPKKAGSNSYSAYTNVAALYSAKPCDSLRAVMERLRLKPDWHTETAEFETILQFVCRGSIRVPNDQRPFRIFVYDRHQAEYLHRYFSAYQCGSVYWASLEFENLGFGYDKRDSKRGPKPKVLSFAEEAARKEKRKIDDKERKRRDRAAAKLKKAA